MNMFTQTQISAFERCKRFYYLKMVRKLVWPVDIGEKRSIHEGEDFHLLVRQLLLGFPAESLIIPEGNEDVRRWIDVYLKEQPIGNPEQLFAEKEVSAVFADVLWLGKFDALTITDDRLTIWDWKTGSAKPVEAQYRTAPQTRLYRFLAAVCAPRLLGTGQHPLPAENIEMVYWFPEHPTKTLRLRYSEQEFQQDMTWLRTVAAELSSEEEADYPQTEKPRQCEYCVYRSYCHPETAQENFVIPADELLSEDFYQPGLFPSPSDPEQEQITF